MEPHEEKPIIYTMENKPIVTCAGDQNLFTALYGSLTQQLPREPMEWRRSYGRAPKMIYLEANFVQFKEELLPKEGNKALLTFPFLHIYWTDCCDSEVYKASVKEDMQRWQAALRLHGSVDWLIAVVESDNKKKNKTNILPRTSIVDKIRSDFCNKQSDRCVSLCDPLKESSRSQESWSSFLTKLRTLLLMSFTRNLGRFEDDMRTLREKRTEPGWSFCDYFMVQEELAFVFEMLQQFEDALVQYDELDALFTQYVLNFGAGDGANWLGSFCQPVRSWMCVSVESGGLDCWVFLSSLEVLHRIEGCCDRSQLEANCSHTVGLWTYATEKLRSLGDLCGLVSENGPDSEDLNKTVDLLAGLGAERPETINSPQSPYKKLKETLSSVEAFEKHYLELSHAAMEMYRAIGRLRSARLVGKSLAEFYMRKGDPQSAENFLLDSLKSYVSESWSLPLTHTRKQIAECQKQLQKMDEYPSLITERRVTHQCSCGSEHELLHSAAGAAFPSVLGAGACERRPAAGAASLQSDARSCDAGADLRIHFTQEQPGSTAQKRAAQNPDGTVTFPAASPASASALELCEILEHSPSDNALSSAGVACRNMHLLMRRHDSTTSLDTPNTAPAVAMEDAAQMLRASDVTLLPGNNSIVFTAPSQKPGSYTLRQLCVTLGRVQFILPHIYPVVQYEVYSQEPQLSIQPLTEHLLAGLPQQVKFTILTGHYSVKKGDALQLSNTDSMPVLHSSTCSARILSSSAGERDTRHNQVHYQNTQGLWLADGSSFQCVCVQLVFRQQCVFSVWELRWSGVSPVSVHCEFSAAFAPADAPDAALKPYRYDFTLERVSTLYSVRAEIRPAVGEQQCCTGSLCRLEVSLTRLSEASDSDEEYSETDGLRSSRLLYEVIDNSSNWAVCGKSSGVVSMPVAAMATHKVHMEVMPLFAGHLLVPSIRVFKYQPRLASPVIQPDTDSCLENDSLSLEDQAETASLRSRGSVQSLGSGESAQPRGPMPKRQAFGPGQVFSGTQGQQVLVLPAADLHLMEVNVT
ncbi:trafficking protein particle complex subunit 10 [Sinocyclocheilus rhinocerous]|uniref:trafficking protein particle complex subunit 10 n=1 Tax=Sinocyclocheilus rhinocerous TaxID=307959 RepID=UPI0007B9A5DC|nr:PREDICTED: trafficking protein particle complex subunit 10-like [Sinocyclocheilus rhinocerous]